MADIQRIFLHWTIWRPPLTNEKIKMWLRHVLSWPRLGLEPKCHDAGTFGGFGYPADFYHWTIWGLQMKNPLFGKCGQTDKINVL